MADGTIVVTQMLTMITFTAILGPFEILSLSVALFSEDLTLKIMDFGESGLYDIIVTLNGAAGRCAYDF